MCSFRQGLYISYCGKSGIGQRLIIRRSVWVKLSFLGKYVVKFHASKFFNILLMMKISKINRSQHEIRNVHVFYNY